jgi:3-oxoacid CoA-transferase subunit B
MEHQAKGQPKLLSECTLPLTGRRVADLVITDLGVFEIQKRGAVRMTLTGLADGVTVDEIKAKTGADFEVDLARQSAAA